MGRLFIILALIGAFIIWTRWRKLKTREQRRDFIYKGLVLGLVAFICVLAAFGRIDVLGAVFATALLSIKFILAFLIRHFPFVAKIYGVTGGFGLGKKRKLKTRWLEIQIDFKNRTLEGEVLQGQFQGQKLQELSEAQLQKLLQECSEDAKSAYFVRIYMQQRAGAGQQQSQNSGMGGDMSAEEALEILGLEGQPDAKEIRTAHKRLIQRLHPDRGGNDFLATLINRARDRLLDGK